ncbi:MAG: Redoxin domain protein [Planctomycetota bacterium]|nr:Redoxin domain protein [Planctomycetota bacterium]
MMIPHQPRIHSSALAFLTVMLAAGCGSTESGSSSATRADFTAKTQGSAEALLEHIDQLSLQFGESEAEDPAAVRKLLRDYSSAVVETAKAIIKDTKADPVLRQRATTALFATLSRSREADPKVMETIIQTSERIEAENPKTNIAAIAAFERCKAYGLEFQLTPVPDRPGKMKNLAEAVDHLGRLDPPPEPAPELVNKTAMDSEVYGHPEFAEKLYTTLIEAFPEDDRVPFAKGALARLKLKGQILEGLEGPGRDDKTTSLKDFRGKVVLVDFWGTLCVPCTNEIPAMEGYRKTMEAKGFVILGVCVDPSMENYLAYSKEMKLDWPQIFSKVTNQKMNSVMTHRFGVQRLPFKMLIDRDGRFLASGHYFEDLKPELDKLLGPEKPETAAPGEKK